MPRSIPLADLAPGLAADLTRRLSLADLAPFAARFGAGGAGFAPRALLAEAVATRLPGPGSVILAESLRHHAAPQEGEALTLRLSVVSVDAAAGTALLAVRIDGPAGPVLSGEVEVRPPAEPTEAEAAPGPAHLLPPLLARCAGRPPVPTAVVHPVDADSLKGALAAAEAGLILPHLVGPEARIRAAAAAAGADISALPLTPTEHSHAAAEAAVRLVSEGRCGALMKGSLHTDELLSAALSREAGLRTDRRVSHCFVLAAPLYPRLLLITDAAVNINPDLKAKADIARNAIRLAHAIGIDRPRVAVLSAVETVTPDIASTLDAAALCKMADRGQITGGLLDGPLAFDNAVSPDAARAKGIAGPVAGRADILLCPDLESGNMLAKQLAYLGGAESAGLLLGLRVPVALTSRADGAASRLASAALLRLMAA
jgi:phosphate acetyltransferase